MILVFFGSLENFLENVSDFAQNSPRNNPQNCNSGIFLGV